MARPVLGSGKETDISRKMKMADDSNTLDKTRHDPTVIPGNDKFEKARENAVAITHARRHESLMRQMNIQKRLVTRILNREQKKPHLHVVK